MKQSRDLEDRTLERKNAQDAEIQILLDNLENSEKLYHDTIDRQDKEISDRRKNHEKVIDEIKAHYNELRDRLQHEHEQEKEQLQNDIDEKDDELEYYRSQLAAYDDENSEENELRRRAKELREEYARLKKLFATSVDNTKAFNNQNDKLYDLNCLLHSYQSKLNAKVLKTARANDQSIDVINKLEMFGFGYQKSFNEPTEGNLKRQVSIDKQTLKKSKSSIRHRDNYFVDYAVDSTPKENIEQPRSSLRKQRSSNKSKSPIRQTAYNGYNQKVPKKPNDEKKSPKASFQDSPVKTPIRDKKRRSRRSPNKSPINQTTAVTNNLDTRIRMFRE